MTRVFQAILLGGLTAGVLDIADPIIFYGVQGVPPVRILQSVASGLLGPAAFQAGWPAAALGLGLHFLIALTAAAVYVAASLKLPALRHRPFVWGPLYGIAVFIVMNFVVVPLSAARSRPMTFNAALVNLIFAHLVCVGLPIAWFARRAAVSDPYKPAAAVAR